MNEYMPTIKLTIATAVLSLTTDEIIYSLYTVCCCFQLHANFPQFPQVSNVLYVCYFHQGGQYVSDNVVFFCPSILKITQKVFRQIFKKFSAHVGVVTEKNSVFGGVLATFARVNQHTAITAQSCTLVLDKLKYIKFIHLWCKEDYCQGVWPQQGLVSCYLAGR